MFERYTERARRVLFFARYEASQMGSRNIAPEHLLLGLIREGEEITRQLFQRARVEMEAVKSEIESRSEIQEKISTSVEIPLSQETKKVLHYSSEEAEALMHKYVGTEHLLLGLLREKSSLAGQILAEKGMKVFSVREDALLLQKEKGHTIRKKKKELPFLSEFSRDLTALAGQDVFDPLIGRDKELERIVQILCRRHKNNPILLGEAGVGKTAIIEGLAQRIIKSEVPVTLSNRRIFALDLSLIVAGTKYRGQFEERLKSILNELTENKNIIIFIDEIHTLVGAGSAEGSLDAANILKPVLARGEVQCIGSTTPREYRRYIEKDRSLLRRFQSVKVSQPTEDEALNILHGVRERYEQFHNVRYDDEALHSSVYQSNRYISDRFLPDKAIDVLDEAGSLVKLRDGDSCLDVREMEGRIGKSIEQMKEAISKKDFETAARFREEELTLQKQMKGLKERWAEEENSEQLVVTKEEVMEVISNWTGIPVASIHEEESEKLLNMEDGLHQRIVGQDEAITALSRAIRRSRAGLKSPARPVGSFIFLGPTGVGKTEVARSLAEFLFGSERSLIRFDMSEYMERHSVAKLIGSPPGYVGYEEGGLLTERVKRNPYSVVLLDEIEKAHPQVYNILLQVFDDGQITDAFGNLIDFKNTLVLMTSNIGARIIQKQGRMGFRSHAAGAVSRDIRELVMAEVKREFNPEFLNRLDDVIVFDPLTDEDLLAISLLMINQLNETMAESKITLAISTEACRWLVNETCNEKIYGARPLRRGIQKFIENPLSEWMLSRSVDDISGEIRVDLKDNRIVFHQARTGEMINVTS
jgi:ATP-dependent Clp protease ATP-binding subunit ClpC